MRFTTLVPSTLLACSLISAGASGLKDTQNDVDLFLANISVSSKQSLSGDRESARLALLSGSPMKLGHFQPRNGCPPSCSKVLGDTSAWYLYGGFNTLRQACNRTMLLDFALFNPVDKQNSQIAISACAAPYNSFQESTLQARSSSTSSCAKDGVSRTNTTSSLQLSRSGASSSTSLTEVTASLDLLRNFYLSHDSGCNETIKFASSGNAVVGVFAGSGFADQGVLNIALEKLRGDLLGSGAVAEQTVVQLCSNSTARYNFGIYVATDGNFGPVQHALQSWKNGGCVDIKAGIMDWQTVTFASPLALNSSLGRNNTTAIHHKFSGGHGSRVRSSSTDLTGQEDGCNAITVAAGDDHDTLARECGITSTEFAKYNPSLPTSNGFQMGQLVCCGTRVVAGAKNAVSLIAAPQADGNGYCYAYTVKTGDNCASLSASYGVTNDDIEEWNKETWGW